MPIRGLVSIRLDLFFRSKFNPREPKAPFELVSIRALIPKLIRFRIQFERIRHQFEALFQTLICESERIRSQSV